MNVVLICHVRIARPQIHGQRDCSRGPISGGVAKLSLGPECECLGKVHK